MTEFRWGDRVTWPNGEADGYPAPVGTVIDERQVNMVLGDYQACLPLPVAVMWDATQEPWWSPGDELELL